MTMTLHGKYWRLFQQAITLAVMLLPAERVLAETADGQSSVQRVETEHVQPRMMVRQVNASGHWVAREEITIMAPLDGVRVSDVSADIGERVQKGQVLARLERSMLSAQLEQARQGVQRGSAALVQAQARVKEASAVFARARRLQPDGAISSQELEAATAAYAAAQAEQAQAQASVKQARALADETGIRLAHAEVRAPVAGIIVQRQIQTGALVNAQTPLFTLVRDGELEFLAQVPASALSSVAVGMPAQLTGASPLRSGHIRQVGAVVNSDSGYGDVRITIAADASSQPRIGTAGNALIDVEQRQVLALDVRALRYSSDDQMTYVYVIGPDQRVKRVAVNVGWREGEWAEIKSGLTPQDTVVLAGAALLAEGEMVEGLPAAARRSNVQAPTTAQQAGGSVQP